MDLEEVRDAVGHGAGLLHAIRHGDAAPEISRDKEARRVVFKTRNGIHSLSVADSILGDRLLPLLNGDKNRRGGDAHERAEFAEDQRAEFGVAKTGEVGLAAAADKGCESRASGGRAALENRGTPDATEDLAFLFRGNQKSKSIALDAAGRLVESHENHGHGRMDDGVERRGERLRELHRQAGKRVGGNRGEQDRRFEDFARFERHGKTRLRA